MKYKRIKGTKDIYGEEYERWQILFSKAREVIKNYGFFFIDTPTFEKTEIFVHSIGATTDIVEKEMYTFQDMGGRKLTLKPEGTASVLRAVIENNITIPCKLCYFMKMFRQEKPQKGRFREHHQLGFEILGYEDPLVEMEIFFLLRELMKVFEIENYTFEINSIGCVSDREIYKRELKEFAIERFAQLCDDCKRRSEKNPLRILDCKIDSIHLKDFPEIEDFLCDNCSRHHKLLQNYLKEYKIEYVKNPKLVRGLDYYEKTVFEIKYKKLGSQDAIGGGGRYDGLMEMLGGKRAPGCGVALGMERVLLASSLKLEEKKSPVFILYTNENFKIEAYNLLLLLREKDIYSEMVYDTKSLKSQMRRADKQGSKTVIFVGEEEIQKGGYKIRDMEKGEEKFVLKENILNNLNK